MSVSEVLIISLYVLGTVNIRVMANIISHNWVKHSIYFPTLCLCAIFNCFSERLDLLCRNYTFLEYILQSLQHLGGCFALINKTGLFYSLNPCSLNFLLKCDETALTCLSHTSEVSMFALFSWFMSPLSA